jgi:hypothetical protein
MFDLTFVILLEEGLVITVSNKSIKFLAQKIFNPLILW